MNDLLTVKQVARLLQLHEITIRRYIKSGRLSAVRIGRNVRVPRESVDALLQSANLSLHEAPPVYRTGKEIATNHADEGMSGREIEADFLEWIENVRRMAKQGAPVSNPDEEDRLLQLAGAITSPIPDISDRHDEFIGQVIQDDGVNP